MTIWLWVGFIAIILTLLALDLGLLNRKPKVISFRESLGWTACWVTLSLLFSVAVYYIYEHHWFDIGTGAETTSGKKAALDYLSGYIVEQSLSLDNIFVITLIFSYFGVPPQFQHRVLFWGILGAIVMRGVMIGLGAALIHQFEWVMYVFGILLLWTAYKLFRSGDNEAIEPERNPLVRLARKIYPVSNDFEGEHFFTKVNGRNGITPLFLVLLVIESTDLVFAVDSIPAIFAITKDPFIVFTSNIFAILGLRSLFFVLASVVHMFRYLKTSLVFLLAFIGVKMLLAVHYSVHIPTEISLAIIVLTLAAGVIASIALPPKPHDEQPEAAVERG